MVAAAGLLTACGRPPAPEPAPTPIAPGVLTPEWIYAPATAETVQATGRLTVEASVGADGPARLLVTARGARVRAVLAGPATMDATLAAALSERNAAPPMLYAVTEGNLCPAGTSAYLVWAEPELVEGRTLAIAVVSGAAPGETGSTVCRVLRYTRNRETGPEEAR